MFRRPGLAAAALGTTLVALLLAFSAAPADASTQYPKNWRPEAKLTRDCSVRWNYPAPGVQLRVTPLKQGAEVSIRYNVSGGSFRDPQTHHLTYTGTALVEVMARANHKPEKINPHWGFIDRSCLSRQLPLPALSGVGGDGQPRKVDINPDGSAGPGQGASLHITGNATVRDAPRAFVVGNLTSSRHDVFRIDTANCHVGDTADWVHGYAPAARQWGYVQASHLSGCHIGAATATAASAPTAASVPVTTSVPPAAAAPEAGSGIPAAVPAPQQCTTSSFDVGWNVAGVYAQPNAGSRVFEDKHYGNRVTGPTGGTALGWTAVYTAQANPVSGTHLGYMKDAALAYRGCA